LEELAKFDGQNGHRAYIAVDGIVYDVTDVPQWDSHLHAGRFVAGKDYTDELKNAPHGAGSLDQATKIGTLVQQSSGSVSASVAGSSSADSTGTGTVSGTSSASSASSPTTGKANPLPVQLIASILGWLIVTGLLLSEANYFFKLFNMKKIIKMPKESLLRKNYQAFLRWYLRFHPLIGSLTAAALIAHLVLQYMNWGFFITGFIAGSLMILQAILGLYGNFIRHKKRGPWFYAHRVVAILLVLAVIFHIVTALRMVLK
jgi:predicted heme/steroid binding protein